MNNENNNYQNDEKKAILASSNQRRRNNTFSDFPQGGLDKLPPQVIDLEEVVLGSMMLDKDAVSEVIDILTPDSFYLEKNQLIFKAIHDLFNKSEPVDILTVVAQLRKSGNLDAVGGAMYVTMLTTRVGSTSNIEFHARIINEKHIMRELIRSSSEVMKEAYEETSDVFDVLDKAEQNLFNITQSNLRRSYEDMGSLVAKALEQLQLLKGHEDGVVGVPSGLTALDRITSGWQKSDLVIVAARPAMGKTAFTLSIARNAAVEFGKAIAFFSLEMSAVQLVNRLISAETGIAADKLKKGTLEDYEWTQLSEKVERLAEAKIFIDDTPAINIFELRAKCRRLKMQHDIQLIVVDYLQLMSGSTGEKTRASGNREQEISMISRSLKSIAKELNVPVIALSQLSRAVETRGGDKRPMLSDLRESGCVTGDTLLLDAQTGQQIPIRELAQRNNPKEPFTTLALNTQYKLQQATVTNVFYSGQKQVFELTTRSGRKIKASANHPFMKLEGWTRLDKLQIGDKIAVPRCLPNIKSTNPIQNEELILLAHLIGDGCVLPKQPYHYTSSDDSNIAIVQKTAHQLFEIEGRIVDENSFKHIYLPSPYHLTHQVKHPITNWYDKLGIERVRSYEKQLPNAVFACDNNKIALFLHHLWATDGNISWKKANNKQDGTAIYYATTSLILANQVQHLLLRLQVLSTLRTVQQGKYRDIYQIHVQGAENQLLYLQKIGCYGQRGEPIPAMIQHLLQITQNPNYDTIPKDAWHLLIKPTLKSKNISGRAFASDLEMSYCGTGLYKSSISRTRLQRISNILADNTLTNLAQSEVLWDEIIAITPLGTEDVYDATVEGLHNFVANNIIVHNSIEQDADMVIFLYRPEYYGFDQDEEGNSSRGVAEIIIAKHRNGATDTAKVKFIAQNAKFTDLDNNFGGFGTDLSPIGDIITFGSRVNDFSSSPPSSGNSTPTTSNNDDIPF